MPPVDGLGPFGREYWRSLEERARTAEPSPEFPEGAESLQRRDFLKLISASLALAGVGPLAACSKPPAEKILPYAFNPPEVVPGNPLHFATSFVLDGRATGLVVESHEGRPTK